MKYILFFFLQVQRSPGHMVPDSSEPVPLQGAGAAMPVHKLMGGDKKFARLKIMAIQFLWAGNGYF